MGPVPTSPDNRRPSDGEQNDQEAYEQDGWAVGFEVEMNGVGIVASNHDNASTSSEGEGEGDSSPNTDDEEDERYTGYQSLPSAPAGPDTSDADQGDSAQGESELPSFVPSSVRRDFEEALAASPAVHLSDADFKIEHQPRGEGLALDEAKIDAIKSAMSGFHLPPANVPKWAEHLNEKEWKNKLMERIESKQSPTSVGRSN
uniref:Male-enhanced antigen 1 n=1 Tax=Plectus sambesii TaxID=2011161 RepID=A0A914X6T5_9BILA